MNTIKRSNGAPRSAFFLVIATIAGACGGTDAAGPSTSVAEAPLFPDDAAPVPMEEQAALDAAARIDAENADAELEKLKKELEDG
ncbi:MAG: hypothetical protein ACKVXR_00160 [Planctomycetota bacterium]